MNLYEVEVIFQTQGKVAVRAENAIQALQIVDSGNFGAGLGSVQSTVDEIENWDIPIHLDLTVRGAQLMKEHHERESG